MPSRDESICRRSSIGRSQSDSSRPPAASDPATLPCAAASSRSVWPWASTCSDSCGDRRVLARFRNEFLDPVFDPLFSVSWAFQQSETRSRTHRLVQWYQRATDRSKATVTALRSLALSQIAANSSSDSGAQRTWKFKRGSPGQPGSRRACASRLLRHAGAVPHRSLEFR